MQVTTARTRHDETASVTDGRGNVTQYAYNKDGQPTTVTDALGQVITNTTYDRSGRKLEVTDARGTRHPVRLRPTQSGDRTARGSQRIEPHDAVRDSMHSASRSR